MKVKMVITAMLLSCVLYGCSNYEKKIQSQITQSPKVSRLSSFTPTIETPKPIGTDQPNAKETETTFYQMGHAKETDTRKPLDQVKKVVFSYNGYELMVQKSVSIDIRKKELYINMNMDRIDQMEPTAKLTADDINEFMDILRTEKVQDWYCRMDYLRPEEVDPFGWDLILENADGTVEKHSGIGQNAELCTPVNFNTVMKKIQNLKYVAENQKKESIERKDTFMYFQRASDAKVKKPLKQVQKVYFTFSSQQPGEDTMIAIDVAKKEFYSNVSFPEIDNERPATKLKKEEIKQFMDILKEEKVQEWKNAYDDKFDPNASEIYRWSLCLQNADGTKEAHRGAATLKKDCIPSNFDKFINKVMNLKFISENLSK